MVDHVLELDGKCHQASDPGQCAVVPSPAPYDSLNCGNGEYYNQQRAKGKSRNIAVRALAFKWIRILFRCWKSRTPYQEDLYQQALARRANSTHRAVNVQWKTGEGLSKISGFIA
jgi:hypothetical protein